MHWSFLLQKIKKEVLFMREKIMTMERCKEVLGLHFTTKHTGKMEGMVSVSTSCKQNKFCQERSKNENTICSHCYAQTQMKMYKTMEKCLAKNTELLTTQIIPMENLPVINALYFRFEAFGDINNEIQVINYFNLCKKNPKVNFALWTKNPWIIARTIAHGNLKPFNLQIILSSVLINCPADIRSFPFVDKVFTVYDTDYIKANDVHINCGDKTCLGCTLCYNKNDVKYISEKIK